MYGLMELAFRNDGKSNEQSEAVSERATDRHSPARIGAIWTPYCDGMIDAVLVKHKAARMRDKRRQEARLRNHIPHVR